MTQNRRVTVSMPFLAMALALSTVKVPAQPTRPDSAEIASYNTVANKLIDAALADTSAFARLQELVDTFGSRLSGTPNLERAIDWTLEKMRADGLQNVLGEPVMVPH